MPPLFNTTAAKVIIMASNDDDYVDVAEELLLELGVTIARNSCTDSHKCL